MPIFRKASIVAAIIAALLLGGCGASSSGATQLTAAQAANISGALRDSIVMALADLASEAKPAPPEQNAYEGQPARFNTLPRPMTHNCSGSTCTYSGVYECPGGGSIALTGTSSQSASGTVADSFTFTPANCTFNGITMNGDPSVTYSSTTNISAGKVVYPLVSTESGGISFGPNPGGSCALNLTETVQSSEKTTLTGTICGQTVNLSE